MELATTTTASHLTSSLSSSMEQHQRNCNGIYNSNRNGTATTDNRHANDSMIVDGTVTSSSSIRHDRTYNGGGDVGCGTTNTAYATITTSIDINCNDQFNTTNSVNCNSNFMNDRIVSSSTTKATTSLLSKSLGHHHPTLSSGSFSLELHAHHEDTAKARYSSSSTVQSQLSSSNGILWQR